MAGQVRPRFTTLSTSSAPTGAGRRGLLTAAKVTVAALLASVLIAPLPFRAEVANASAAGGTAPFINTWLLAGPFDGSVISDPADSPGEGDEIGGAAWEYFDDRLYNRNLDDYQDLYGHFKIKQGKTVTDNMVAYAAVYVYSPAAVTAKFRIGSSGTHQVWVNGSSVGSLTTAVEVNKDTAAYDISLTSGWNRVLVKQAKTRAYFWGFYARITDGNGNAIEGLQYSTHGDGGALEISTKKLAFTSNDLPTAYTEWPYVWTKSDRGTEHWRPQASKFRFYAGGGAPGYTWDLASGALPAGLTLGSDGTIDGKVSAAPGEYSFSVRVTDSGSPAATKTKAFTIVVKERPNKWIQHAGQVALISAGAAYTATFDENFSADLWAERMKDQGIQAVYFEAGQQSSVWWPSHFQLAPTADYITPYMEAVKRHGIRWGMYYPSEGAGNKHHNSSGFARDVEDLITRYGNPSQWFFDGNPFLRGNLDAMYSIVRAYGDDALILSNATPEQGDTDLKVTENGRYWENALGDHTPWSLPDNKVTTIDAWRHPFTKTLDIWTVYHGGQVRNDWRNFAKAHIVEIATGQMADFDQAITMARGENGSGANPSAPRDTFPVDAQKFIDMRESYAEWINPRLESLIGTAPGPLASASWGFSTQRDNLIYLHVFDAPAPINKTGMPAGGSMTISPVTDTVDEVSVLGGGTLPFVQNGSTVTITTTGVTVDPIDTIIKIKTDKSFTGYPLTSVKATGERTGASTAKVAVEGYLNEYVGLKADLDDVTFASSDTDVATVSAAGVVTAVGQGEATITAEAEYDGVTKSDSITVEVAAGNVIRVTDTMIGAVARLGTKETYYGKLYHHDASASLTLEGRGERGGALDISGAAVTYVTDKPDLVEVSSGGIVTAKRTVTSPQRAAVWATVTQDGTTVTTNKVSFDVTDERIVSVGKIATSSGASGGFSASKAVDGVAYPADGSHSSKWSAASTAGAWWQVDLGAKANINALDIYFNHRNDGYRNVPKSVTYQVSDDGTNWTTIISKSPNVPAEGGYSAMEPHTVSLGAPGRYLRLLFEDGAQASGIDLPEVTVWAKDTLVPNLAARGTVTASSHYDSRYVPSNAVDNVIGLNGSGEWASAGEAKPWVKVQWSVPETINSIVLYDRPNGTDNANSGVLTFSDGSTEQVAGIPTDGGAKQVHFPEKTVDWVKFEATGGTGANVGLSELQALRSPTIPSMNVAPRSTASASSYYDSRYVPAKAIDEVVGANGSGEWAAAGEVNPWIQLDWATSQAIDKVVLFDRVNATDDVNSGTLTFSDGTSISVSGIDKLGAAKEVTFPEKTVTWVKFEVTGGTGVNNGLSELQVWTSDDGRPTDYRAAWGFNGNALDSSANSFDATLAGTAGYSSASPKEGGSSLALDGTTGAKASSPLVTNQTDNVTLTAWVKSSGATSAHQTILANGNTATSGYGLFLNHGDGDRLSILVAGVNVAGSQVVLTSGEWTHVAAVRRSGTWELYVNGEVVPITNSGATPVTPTTGTVIGNDQSNNHAFNGLIDDARIYTRALAAVEISALAE